MNSRSFSALAGDSVQKNAVGIAMEATPAIWLPHQGQSKIFTFPEIAKASSIPKPLNTTAGMNQRRAEGLTQMFVAGVSTEKVGEVAQTLIGVAPSKSSVSRLNQTLTEQFETWRERSLQAHYRVI